MVRVLERGPAQELDGGRRQPAQRVDGRDLHGLMVAKIRQQARQPLRKHGLAGTRRKANNGVSEGAAILALSGRTVRTPHEHQGRTSSCLGAWTRRETGAAAWTDNERLWNQMLRFPRSLSRGRVGLAWFS